MKFLLLIAAAAWLVFAYITNAHQYSQDIWLFALPASYFVVLLVLLRN